MIRAGLRDASFVTESMSTDFEAPAHFRWDRSGAPRFYTDICLRQALDGPHPRVAILIEAPPFRTEFVEFAEAHQDEFDHILTYLRAPLERHDGYGHGANGGQARDHKWLFYPHGGTRIPLHRWGLHEKRKRVSLIASDKTDATGHKLRHEIVSRYGDWVDVLGSINGGAYADKFEGHAPYLYSIVVCGERNDWCFSDHLLDALAVCTIPIYWGCPDIAPFFDPRGVIPFEKADDLEAILPALSARDYEARLPYVLENMERARQYRIAENWIWDRYPFLFEGLA